MGGAVDNILDKGRDILGSIGGGISDVVGGAVGSVRDIFQTPFGKMALTAAATAATMFAAPALAGPLMAGGATTALGMLSGQPLGKSAMMGAAVGAGAYGLGLGAPAATTAAQAGATQSPGFLGALGGSSPVTAGAASSALGGSTISALGGSAPIGGVSGGIGSTIPGGGTWMDAIWSNAKNALAMPGVASMGLQMGGMLLYGQQQKKAQEDMLRKQQKYAEKLKNEQSIAGVRYGGGGAPINPYAQLSAMNKAVLPSYRTS